MVLTVLHLRNAEGEQYRKTLQYGYDRQSGIDRWMGQRLNGLDPYVYTPEQHQEVVDDMYACGFHSPNYPVPSSIGYVSLGQDYYGIVYIDDANADDPGWLYAYDALYSQLIFD